MRETHGNRKRRKETNIAVLVFKTNIYTDLDAQKLATAIEALPGLVEWSVDLGDCDKVLRIVGSRLDGQSITERVMQHGIFCEEMPV